jgi:hypothetical protein
MKIRPVGAELFYADGRTDGHDDANSRFTKFSNASKSPITGTVGCLSNVSTLLTSRSSPLVYFIDIIKKSKIGGMLKHGTRSDVLKLFPKRSVFFFFL